MTLFGLERLYPFVAPSQIVTSTDTMERTRDIIITISKQAVLLEYMYSLTHDPETRLWNTVTRFSANGLTAAA